MTYREKLMKEHPDKVFDYLLYCPCEFNYEEHSKLKCGKMDSCEDCWNREIPEEVKRNE